CQVQVAAVGDRRDAAAGIGGGRAGVRRQVDADGVGRDVGGRGVGGQVARSGGGERACGGCQVQVAAVGDRRVAGAGVGGDRAGVRRQVDAGGIGRDVGGRGGGGQVAPGCGGEHACGGCQVQVAAVGDRRAAGARI